MGRCSQAGEFTGPRSQGQKGHHEEIGVGVGGRKRRKERKGMQSERVKRLAQLLENFTGPPNPQETGQRPEERG